MEWMGESPGNYYPNMVLEFYANYVATLDDQCKKGKKPTEMHMLLHVPVHGEIVYISAATINRMLYGPDFTSPARNTEFDYRMREEAYVPILAEIDVERNATNKYDLKKSKDETRYDKKLHKLVIEVFGSGGPSARVAEQLPNPLKQ
ncbi:hypothetical protein HAX54_047036 [Datura stramonium]|uniref:Uncharacterized protein n=1 Tax=Datura stramonium TaxID=4076 RepID=A0ABS8WHT4_DATST|nr:hypothetical protein [Datura stramonium]